MFLAKISPKNLGPWNFHLQKAHLDLDKSTRFEASSLNSYDEMITDRQTTDSPDYKLGEDFMI